MSDKFETISQLTDHFVKTAEKFIGAHEGGPQHSLLLAVYNANKPAGEYTMTKTDPWCAAFIGGVSACAGTMKSVPLSAHCGRLESALKKCGAVRVINPQNGDIALFDWNGDGKYDDHAGIVSEVGEHTVRTIEGNKNDSVNYREFSIRSTPVIFYRPAWINSIGQSTDYTIDITPSEGIMWEKYRDFYHELTPAFQRQIRELPLLYGGCGGIYVKIAQKYLGIKEDGHFGTNTETAVKLYQKKAGIPQTGCCDAVTWGKLLGG